MMVVDILPELWDSANGIFLGRDLSSLGFLLEVYNIPKTPLTIQIISAILEVSRSITNEKLKKGAASNVKK